MSNNFYTDKKSVVDQMRKQEKIKKKFELNLLKLAKNDPGQDE